jgi:chromatin segregation and condensation protein Rec8/ScpA/Scc1 (kleisin family)
MNLTVGEFKWPLEKLLELIEAEKVDVSEVSMARIKIKILTRW